MTKPSELEQLIPTPRTIHVGGKEIPIRNLKVKHLTAVLKAVQPILGLFTKGKSVDIPSLLIDHSDSAISLICVLTEETPEWLGELDVDELVMLFTAIVEVNLSFFTQRVFPSLSQAMAQLNGDVEKLTKQAGQATSST